MLLIIIIVCSIFFVNRQVFYKKTELQDIVIAKQLMSVLFK